MDMAGIISLAVTEIAGRLRSHRFENAVFAAA
jgi:hypothetical protein